MKNVPRPLGNENHYRKTRPDLRKGLDKTKIKKVDLSKYYLQLDCKIPKKSFCVGDEFKVILYLKNCDEEQLAKHVNVIFDYDSSVLKLHRVDNKFKKTKVNNNVWTIECIEHTNQKCITLTFTVINSFPEDPISEFTAYISKAEKPVKENINTNITKSFNIWDKNFKYHNGMLCIRDINTKDTFYGLVVDSSETGKPSLVLISD